MIWVIKPQSAKSDLRHYADEVLENCRGEKYRPSCYDREIPKLMDTISMEQAFEVTRLVQDKDPQYAYCHVLGHELSAREVRKDLSKWKDVVTRVPSGLCSNGGIHGAFQERFRAEYFTDDQKEEMKSELAVVCEKRGTWSPTGLEQASCYHALGHLTMYLSQAEINESLVICDQIAQKRDGRDYRRLCYDGAFMQIYQPLEPEDFALVEGKEVPKNELYDYCAKFPQAQRSSCWSEGWPLYRNEILKPEGLVDFCSKAVPSEQRRCHDGLVYVVTAQFGLDGDKMLPYCSAMPELWKGRCFGNAATRMIETDYRNISKAVDFCKATTDSDPGHYCFSQLSRFADYNFLPGSNEFYALCESLPIGWKYKCLGKNEFK